MLLKQESLAKTQTILTDINKLIVKIIHYSG